MTTRLARPAEPDPSHSPLAVGSGARGLASVLSREKRTRINVRLPAPTPGPGGGGGEDDLPSNEIQTAHSTRAMCYKQQRKNNR